MITQALLKDLFDYDPDGWLIRKKTGQRVKCSPTKGQRYLRVYIEGKPRTLHRMVYIWHHGDEYTAVDHINGDRFDNRIENLRSATQQENCINRKQHRNSKSTHKNVFWHSAMNKWTAVMSVNGSKKVFGYFDDIDLAGLVAFEAREKFHGPFARHS